MASRVVRGSSVGRVAGHRRLSRPANPPRPARLRPAKSRQSIQIRRKRIGLEVREKIQCRRWIGRENAGNQSIPRQGRDRIIRMSLRKKCGVRDHRVCLRRPPWRWQGVSAEPESLLDGITDADFGGFGFGFNLLCGERRSVTMPHKGTGAKNFSAGSRIQALGMGT